MSLRWTLLSLIASSSVLALACSARPGSARFEESGDTSGGAPGTTPGMSGQWLDPNGVTMFYPANTSGSSWLLGANASDPNADPELVIQDDGNGSTANGNYFTSNSYTQSLASGGTDLTFRLNVNVMASQGPQTTDHDLMAQQGYMVSPQDIRNLEMTGYFRLDGIEDTTKMVVMKVRGGTHTGVDDPQAACLLLCTEIADNDDLLWGKELFHPTQPRFAVDEQVNHPTLDGVWFGVKGVVYNATDANGNTMTVAKQWIDLSPFDASGNPLNNWQLVYEYGDGEDGNGGMPVTWGGKFETWRVDGVDTIDYRLLSVHEIVPPADETVPTQTDPGAGGSDPTASGASDG